MIIYRVYETVQNPIGPDGSVLQLLSGCNGKNHLKLLKHVWLNEDGTIRAYRVLSCDEDSPCLSKETCNAKEALGEFIRFSDNPLRIFPLVR